jgi:uncharacterized protein YigE (DUF2233 family)
LTFARAGGKLVWDNRAEVVLANRSGTTRSSILLLLFLAVVCVAGTAAYRAAKKPKGVLAKLDYCSAVIDLPSGGYRVAPALARTDQRETFDALISRIKPFAAITGTYYGPDYAPLGDIVTDGKLVRRGYQRQGIGFTPAGRIRFLERHGSARIDWKGCRAGVACGPRLVRGGRIRIDVRADGFRPAAAKIEATRCAVGATRDGKLVMLAVREPVTLHMLAQAMVELGAVDAINLDGGALCGFYSDGRCRAEPIRPVSNVLAVYKVK